MTAPMAIRAYQPADEAPVLDLLNLALGTGRAFERSLAFFRWKHVENPFGPSLMLLAENEQLTGLRAFLRWQFRAGPQTIHAVRAVDTATHPKYQRMGIFSRLTTACLDRARTEGVHLVFNTPNRYSLPGYLKLGWTYVRRTTVIVRPLRPLRMLRALAGRPAADPGGEGLRLRPVDDLVADEGALAALLGRDDALLADGIRTARSPAFLRWRYARVPSLRYGAHWTGDDRPRAAVIARMARRRGLRELTVCELCMEDEQAGRRVLREVLRDVGADYAVAHCAWPTGHRRVFLSQGFVPLRVGPHFTVRPLASFALNPIEPAHWRLALGDLEIF